MVLGLLVALQEGVRVFHNYKIGSWEKVVGRIEKNK